MDARTRREAIGSRLSHTRHIAACVSDQPVRIVGADRRSGGSTTIAFASVFTPVRLRTAKRARLGFAFSLDVDLTENDDPASRTTRISSYLFRLVDAADQEILAYHWHPRGISSIRHPHAHISGHIGALAGGPSITNLWLSSFHLPTGHLTLADVVRFLIAEVGVEPRRPDWEEILIASEM